MMKYANSITDSHGYVHSIDMILVDYYLVCSYQRASKLLLELLADVGANSSLGNLPNFKYQYYVDMVWCDGIVLHLGKYSSYDASDKSWLKLDMLRLEVNPNKHVGTPLLDRVLGFLQEYCRDGVLVRYDYAIDVPVSLDDVLVVSSRKEKGLYRGTRYFGRRHNHGYLKIYDKGREQHEDMTLTRLEYTFSGGQIPMMENIVIRAPAMAQNGLQKLSAQSRLYLDMLTEIQALGGQIEPYIERMNYRTWKHIEPYLFSGVRLQLDNDVIERLLSKIDDIFIIFHIAQNVNSLEEFVEAGELCLWEQ